LPGRFRGSQKSEKHFLKFVNKQEQQQKMTFIRPLGQQNDSISSLLHTKPTTSLWQDTMRDHAASVGRCHGVRRGASKCKPLPATVDVCIVGSGMSGTSLAYWFAMNQNSKET
jgi:hypothetical protein